MVPLHTHTHTRTLTRTSTHAHAHARRHTQTHTLTHTHRSDSAWDEQTNLTLHHGALQSTDTHRDITCRHTLTDTPIISCYSKGSNGMHS